ncbi:MAG: 3-phosphoshikimate 1-carboxyvinyltransferase [Kofleriaceae bacterium]|nr:3-phosphoshikimate 1-carboxyvinyltransferase [Kofleriaceae bacterium]
MSSLIVKPSGTPLIGSARIPGDKSIGHRSLLFSALADGDVVVKGLSPGKDNERTRHAMAALGVEIEDLPTGQICVHGVGLRGLKRAADAIECGNSGTTMRLLAGILAAQPFDSVMVGDSSLSVRPMRRIAAPLRLMGASLSGESGKDEDEIYPPLRIGGLGDKRLQGIRYEQPVASAQVKSAILLAGLFAEGETVVVEPGASRDHTESMLAHMGAPLTVLGNVITLDTRGWDGRLQAAPISVPGDPSSAAFIVAAALVAGVERVGVYDVCMSRRRTGFLDALGELGGRVEQECRSETSGGPVADLVVSYGAADHLQGAVIEGEMVLRALDELPILAIVAARAHGVSDFRDAGELRIKESDRIATTCEMLRNLGVEVEEREDGFSLEGLGGAPFKACEIDSHGDHRIAMSGVIAGLAADGPVRVTDAANVATSFPSFVETLNALGAQIENGE